MLPLRNFHALVAQPLQRAAEARPCVIRVHLVYIGKLGGLVWVREGVAILLHQVFLGGVLAREKVPPALGRPRPPTRAEACPHGAQGALAGPCLPGSPTCVRVVSWVEARRQNPALHCFVCSAYARQEICETGVRR